MREGDAAYGSVDIGNSKCLRYVCGRPSRLQYCQGLFRWPGGGLTFGLEHKGREQGTGTGLNRGGQLGGLTVAGGFAHGFASAGPEVQEVETEHRQARGYF